jgi:hypothetical protein
MTTVASARSHRLGLGVRLDGETKLGVKALGPASSPRNFDYFASKTECVPLRELSSAFAEATPAALHPELRTKLRDVFRHAAVRVENLAKAADELGRPDISHTAIARIGKRIADASFTFQELEKAFSKEVRANGMQAPAIDHLRRLDGAEAVVRGLYTSIAELAGHFSEYAHERLSAARDGLNNRTDLAFREEQLALAGGVTSQEVDLDVRVGALPLPPEREVKKTEPAAIIPPNIPAKPVIKEEAALGEFSTSTLAGNMGYREPSGRLSSGIEASWAPILKGERVVGSVFQLVNPLTQATLRIHANSEVLGYVGTEAKCRHDNACKAALEFCRIAANPHSSNESCRIASEALARFGFSIVPASSPYAAKNPYADVGTAKIGFATREDPGVQQNVPANLEDFARGVTRLRIIPPNKTDSQVQDMELVNRGDKTSLVVRTIGSAKLDTVEGGRLEVSLAAAAAAYLDLRQTLTRILVNSAEGNSLNKLAGAFLFGEKASEVKVLRMEGVKLDLTTNSTAAPIVTLEHGGKIISSDIKANSLELKNEVEPKKAEKVKKAEAGTIIGLNVTVSHDLAFGLDRLTISRLVATNTSNFWGVTKGSIANCVVSESSIPNVRTSLSLKGTSLKGCHATGRWFRPSNAIVVGPRFPRLAKFFGVSES